MSNKELARLENTPRVMRIGLPEGTLSENETMRLKIIDLEAQLGDMTVKLFTAETISPRQLLDCSRDPSGKTTFIKCGRNKTCSCFSHIHLGFSKIRN